MQRCWTVFTVAIIAALLLSACSSRQELAVSPSGFLGDYSKLTPGGEGYAVMLWYKKDIDLRPYDKVILDPVRVYLKGEAANRGIEPQELAELTKFYEAELMTALTRGNGYARTSTPGPGVLRIRVAITDVVPGNAVMGTLSSINPVGLAISGGYYAVQGTHLHVGQAATEIEILDSATGERLAASVDRRSGGKAPFKGSLDDAKEAFEFWANRLRMRLDAGRFAVAPE